MGPRRSQVPHGAPMGPTMIYGKILENYMKNMGNIWPKWAHNGPFELSAGPREHRERVRSLDSRQLEPPKTFPGLKNVKNVSKNCVTQFLR